MGAKATGPYSKCPCLVPAQALGSGEVGSLNKMATGVISISKLDFQLKIFFLSWRTRKQAIKWDKALCVSAAVSLGLSLNSLGQVCRHVHDMCSIFSLPSGQVTSRPDCYWGRNCRTQVEGPPRNVSVQAGRGLGRAGEVSAERQTNPWL